MSRLAGDLMGVRTRLLLASHDTIGSRAAEQQALEIAEDDGTIHHLVVVPDFWKGMRGDDWLNNVATQDRFARYLESELEQEIGAHVSRLGAAVRQRGIAYKAIIRQGDPTQCILEAARESGCGMVVTGAPRPKGVQGYRCRVDLERLVRGLAVPLLIVPHPGP